MRGHPQECPCCIEQTGTRVSVRVDAAGARTYVEHFALGVRCEGSGRPAPRADARGRGVGKQKRRGWRREWSTGGKA